MKPDEFYSTELGDFLDMVEGSLLYELHKEDTQLEWMSWFVSNMMMSGGNMKKGTKADKLAKQLYPSLEDRLKEAEKKSATKIVSKEEIKKQQEELVNRFNLQ